MFACIPSSTIQGARGRPVQVEVCVAGGLPAVALVGQPDAACREGLHRVRVAFAAAHLPWPGDTRKVTINLAPPGFRKLGSGLDLAIAVGAAVAADLVPAEAVAGLAFAGELGLDGSVRSMPGLAPMVAVLADVEGVEAIAVPAEAHTVAAAIAGPTARPVATFIELIDALRSQAPWPDPPERNAAVVAGLADPSTAADNAGPGPAAGHALGAGPGGAQPAGTGRAGDQHADADAGPDGAYEAGPGPVRARPTGAAAARTRSTGASPQDGPDRPWPPPLDLADVRGQPVARRALEVAAAGGHHLLLCGPPGAGKTMLARRLPGILPPLDRRAAVEVTCIWSAAGQPLPDCGLIQSPPFRAPHHSLSTPALVGGGSVELRPGEASCAHRGVLFLDEMGEFPAVALDALRTPLEEGVIRVSRAREAVELPARFLLVGATNPCPCGEGGPIGSACRCDPRARSRYLRRLSGPLLDRFDLRVDVARPSSSDLLGAGPGEPSTTVAARIALVRSLTREQRGVDTNAALDAGGLDRWAVPGESAVGLLETAVRTGRLSARGLARVRAVARTLADLDGATGPVLDGDHVAAALALRQPLGGLEARSAA